MTMATLRLFSAQKLLPIIPTKIKLTGSQMRTISRLNGSLLTMPSKEQSSTARTQNKH